ncbi:MAG: MraY family glycosyltransferase [Cyanobium sp.]
MPATSLLPTPPQPPWLPSPSWLHQPLAMALVAGALSWLVLWQLLPLLRRNLLDRPNQRSAHTQATPRGGGLSFVLVGTVLSLVLGEGPAAWIPLVCLPLAVIGLIDDRADLPAALRYLAQAATAVALLLISSTPLPLWSLPIALIAITAVINFFNFMDGLDGLVALSALVLMAAAGQPVLVGALAGFLLWNWSPARVFMGDVGSTWLGAVFAGLVLQRSTPLDAAALLVVAFPLLGDALACVLRRLRAGQHVFQAHRLHLFQRLHQAGWSHRRVAGLYGSATALLGLALLVPPPQGWSVVALALVAELTLAWRLEHKAAPFAASGERS